MTTPNTAPRAAAPQGQAITVPRPAEKSTALSPYQDFNQALDRMKPQLAAAIPTHVKIDRFIRIVLTTIRKTPELLECTPPSLIGALLECAQLGLDPGVLGQAYLVPFRNKGVKEVQLIPGYKGLIKLAYQSGEVGSIVARVVRAKDEFRYWYGLDEGIEHVPCRTEDAGELVAVYAHAQIKGVVGKQFLVLDRWEIDKIRQRSASSNRGPWVTDYEEMAKKSALRRLCKLLPSSVEKDNLARAVEYDELHESGRSQNLDYSSLIDVPAGDGTGPMAPLPDKPFAPDSTPAPAEPARAEGGAPAAKPTSLGEATAQGKQRRRMTIEMPGATAGEAPPELDDSVISGPPKAEEPPEPGSEG